MTVGFITEHDLNNAYLRSGVPYHIARGMEEAGIYYKEIRVSDNRSITDRLFSRYKQWYYTRFLKNKFGRYDIAFSQKVSASYTKTIHHYIEDVDILFTINPVLVACVNTTKPIVIWIDNSFRSFYQNYINSDLCRETVNDALATEMLAFEKAKKIFTASNWLKVEVAMQYQNFDNKVQVLPRGANISQPFTNLEIKRQIDEKVTSDVLNILFVVSGSWERKGGDMVLKIWKALRTKLATTLTIVGALDDSILGSIRDEGINYIGRIDKNNAIESKKYATVFSRAHYLIIPSNADGFGIVYAEAASFGVPSLAFSVMGVTEAIKQNITGWHFPLNSDEYVFVEKIISNWGDKDAYICICKSAYDYATKNFDWKKNVKKLF